jgi:hypothetical protein
MWKARIGGERKSNRRIRWAFALVVHGDGFLAKQWEDRRHGPLRWGGSLQLECRKQPRHASIRL